MRICWVLPEAEYAGGTRVIAIYCQLLMARGHEVVVISTPRLKYTLRRRLRVLLRQKRLLPRAVNVGLDLRQAPAPLIGNLRVGHLL